jgi:hypothetical protein
VIFDRFTHKNVDFLPKIDPKSLKLHKKTLKNTPNSIKIAKITKIHPISVIFRPFSSQNVDFPSKIGPKTMKLHKKTLKNAP